MPHNVEGAPSEAKEIGVLARIGRILER